MRLRWVWMPAWQPGALLELGGGGGQQARHDASRRVERGEAGTQWEVSRGHPALLRQQLHLGCLPLKQPRLLGVVVCAGSTCI